MARAYCDLICRNTYLVEDFGRTCFCNYTWEYVNHTLTSVKGFWYRADDDVLDNPHPHTTKWPYWDRFTDISEGNTDWTKPVTYVDGSFWGGLAKCCGGPWHDCGTIDIGGFDNITTFNMEMLCCDPANPPWDWYVDVSGFTGACAIYNGRHNLNYQLTDLPNTCYWDNTFDLTDPVGVALVFNTVTNLWQFDLTNFGGSENTLWTSTTAPSFSSPSNFDTSTGVGVCVTDTPTILLTPIAHFTQPPCVIGCGLTTEGGDSITDELGNVLDTEQDCTDVYIITESGDSLITENPKYIIQEINPDVLLLTQHNYFILSEAGLLVVVETNPDSLLLTENGFFLTDESDNLIQLD